MPAIKGMVVRDVTPKECHWLSEKVSAGRNVFRYYGVTYGCVSNNGVAVTDQPDKTPFYELPFDAVRWLDDSIPC